MTQSPSSYVTLDAFEETGYVVLDRYDQSADPTEWLDIEYVDWKSSGDTRFSPLASAFGDLECDGFWNHTPPQDRQGRRLGRRQRREGPAARRAGAGAGREHRPLPGHRAAAELVRRHHLQPAPRRQQPAQPRGHRLDRARVLQPHRRPRFADGAARGQGRPVDRVPDPAAGRCPADRRHPAALPRRLPPRRRSRATA